jgi:hypothetical protein
LDACPIYLVPYLINDGERYASMFGRADVGTRTAHLLITSDRSGVAAVCRGLQIPHS